MMIKDVAKVSGEIPSVQDLPIRYDLYYPRGADEPLKPVIFLHGFKGFKDWGTFPAVCQKVAEAGFAVVAMNFSLNGIGENPMEFTRLDLFGQETFSDDLDDVRSVIEAIKTKKIGNDNVALDTNEMGVLGHSRGGQTAVAAAAENDEISCLVTWSAVADYNERWSDQMLSDWQTKGVTEIKNGRTGQIMPMKKVVYDDARQNADRVIALNRVDELQMPALFIHATNDDAVSSKNAEQLYEACSSDKKDIMLIPETGHTFGGSHPFNDETLPAPLQKAVKKTRQWFKENMK